MIMTPGEVFQTGFSPWVKWAYPLKGRVQQGAPLDPFATSLRTTKMMVDRINEIVSTGSIQSGSRPSQAMTDMGIHGAGLAAGTAANAKLTPFGADVLEEWTRLGIAVGDAENEIARCGVLIRLGIEQGMDTYTGLFRNWNCLVRIKPAEYWLQDVWHLFLPSYLDKTDKSGYNGFRVITAVNDGDVGDRQAWDAMAQADADLRPYLEILIGRVSSGRYGQRASICRAMELYRMRQLGNGRVPEQIRAWR